MIMHRETGLSGSISQERLVNILTYLTLYLLAYYDL